jgi:hypothetical protein
MEKARFSILEIDRGAMGRGAELVSLMVQQHAGGAASNALLSTEN